MVAFVIACGLSTSWGVKPAKPPFSTEVYAAPPKRTVTPFNPQSRQQVKLPKYVQVQLFHTEARTRNLSCIEFQQTTRMSPHSRTYPKGFQLKTSAANFSGTLTLTAASPATPLKLSPCQGKPALSYRPPVQLKRQGTSAWQVYQTLPLANYVEQVVSAETPPGWPTEALKAQAVVTQTRLAQRYAEQGYTGETVTVVDSTQDELFQGITPLRPEVTQAVRSVLGQVVVNPGTNSLSHGATFYHAACGGKTVSPELFSASPASPQPVARCALGQALRQLEKNRKASGKPSPDLKNTALQNLKFHLKQSAYSYHTPTRHRLAWKTLRQRMHWQYPPTLLTTDATGRPTRFRIYPTQTSPSSPKSSTVGGYALWLTLGQTLGWHVVPSTAYSLRLLNKQGKPLSASSPEANAPDWIEFTSWGAGHGVGLCQWGARAMAEGWFGPPQTYQEILQHYFPQTVVIKSF